MKAKRQARTERERGLLGSPRGYRKQNQAQQTRKTEQQEERTNTARRRGGRDTQTALHTITQPSLQKATHRNHNNRLLIKKIQQGYSTWYTLHKCNVCMWASRRAAECFWNIYCVFASVTLWTVWGVRCVRLSRWIMCRCSIYKVCVMSVTGKAGDSLPGAALALAVERTTWVGVEILVTSWSWLSTEERRLTAPWNEPLLLNVLTTSICRRERDP